MRLLNIIKKNIVTEKAVDLKKGIKKKEVEVYALEVSPKATKIDIKKAISYVYGVEVESVRVLNTREKYRNTKNGVALKKRTSRKAYVKLKDSGKKIDFSIINFK